MIILLLLYLINNYYNILLAVDKNVGVSFYPSPVIFGNNDNDCKQIIK